MHQIAPDTAKRSLVQPTHWHCYRWSGAGGEWDRVMKTDTLDLHSPDRPPVRTVDWLIKSRRFVMATPASAAEARDWLIGEWDAACERAMSPVPDWVDTKERGERALRAIETGCWPSWQQWTRGGVVVLMAVVGTDRACH